MVGLNAQLVKDTFESEFDDVKFRNFLSELSGKSINKKKNITNYIGKGFNDYIQSVHDCGYFKDIEHERIGFYIIELKKSSSISRARTMQRNVIAHVLRNSSNDCALAAFYEPGSPDWRFSFANLEYELDEKGNIEEKLAPAKRHSFLVGPNEPNYTCKKQFFDLLAKGKILVRDIEVAFNIENVTKEFFKEYRNLFHELTDAINLIIDNDITVAQEFNSKNIKVTDFAKRLLGQIVFLYFVQKKGWLGVPKDGQWGDGPKNFMRRLFDGEYIPYEKNKFFDDVIEPLFYQGLSEGVSDFHYSKFNCKIPFLNGGLFENINNYDWQHTDLVIPDAIFAKVFAVFDKFNFTVKEDEPLDKEVAVDPEMLGKVFENLLEVDDRKSKGAFYTPRHIVHYMCQQTLIYYLNDNTENIPIEDITLFIEKGHLALDSIIKSQEEANKYNGKSFTKFDKYITKSIQENVGLIEELLINVKVVDPAVGSGAFPVGMMTEIVHAREVLNALQGFESNLYDLKRETIENSLYGVDLSNSAVDITKLRFWLSLIVDEEDIENIRPLPNLDNHIMCGDSLLDTFNGVKLFDRNLITNMNAQTTLTMKGSEKAFRTIEKIKPLYFNENNPNEKRKLKKRINDIKWEFIKESYREAGKYNIEELIKYQFSPSKPFFIWELEFSEIFDGVNKGFDIAIGNPPYVKSDNQDEDFKEERQKILNSGNYETLYEKWDLFIAFIEKGIQLLNEKGHMSFIVSNSYNTAKSAKKSHEYIINNHSLEKIDLFKNVKLFEEAEVENVIIFAGNEHKNNPTERILHENSFENKVKLSPERIPNNIFRFDNNLNYEEKFDNTILLTDLCYISYGLRPNSSSKVPDNEKFGKDDVLSVTKDNIFCKSYTEGKYLNRYQNNKILYLEWGTNRVPSQIYTPTFPELYVPPKIIRGTTSGAIFDDSGLICNHSCSVVVPWNSLKKVSNRSIDKTVTKKLKELNFTKNQKNKLLNQLYENSKKFDLKYILAIMNSKMAYNYLNSIRTHRLKNYIYPDELKKLPIKNISLKDQEPFIDLVNKILMSNDKDHIEKLEHEIDLLIYDLYSLNKEEIDLIENSFYIKK